MRNRPSGFANPWFQLWLSVLCVLVSELLLKRGASATAHLAENWSWTGITGLASPLVWVAALIYSGILCGVAWLFFLRARGRIAFWI